MNEQILREQIAELMKLLELKDMRIKELEALRTIPQLYQGPWANAVPLADSSNTITITDCNKCRSK